MEEGKTLDASGLWNFLYSLRNQPFQLDLDHLTPLHIVLALAHHPPCWMLRKDTSQLLKNAFKEVYVELHGKTNSKGLRYIPSGAWEKDIPDEHLDAVFERYGVSEKDGKECFEKYQGRQRALHPTKPKKRPMVDSDGMEQVDEEEALKDEGTVLIKWTDEDNQRLLLAYHILYFHPRFSNNPRRCINWRLLDTVYCDQSGSKKERLRRRTIASRQLYNLLKTFKWRTEYYKIAEMVAAIGECTIDNFKGMFDYYASQAVDEQVLKELKEAKYVPLPPFSTLTRECRRRLPEEVQLKIMNVPFAPEPEEDVALEVKRLKLSLIKKDGTACTDGMCEKAGKGTQDNNLSK